MQRSTATPLRRIFIANRGEICRRIALSARLLGLETVCYSDRADPPHYLRGLIDTFVRVPEENPQLYLDSEGIIAAARAHQCDAIHPGFGFLSESAAFAAAVEASGLVWIGPSSQTIAAMATKDSARALAQREGVPCPRSYGQRITSPELSPSLLAAATEIGYPLLVKAASGGGGKGMRLVNSPGELAPALERAFHEAQHFFGDGTLLLEQYLPAARHVEVQLLGDRHGNLITLGDRDCSLQRRKQKIIEEAPAPGLSPKTRQALHRYALQLGNAVAYESAGTVEFILSPRSSEHAGDYDIYFLEMNTRLQVEHPVTEEVFGLDLVAWQLRIAQGHSLPPELAQARPRGHSIEVRLYGEDYENNYLPAPGFVPYFKPHHQRGIRWEVGLDESDEISSRFDPMIAKVVAWAETREQARATLAMCLARTFFSGKTCNKDLLLYLLSDEATTTAWHTDYIERNAEALRDAIAKRRDTYRADGEALLTWLSDTLQFQHGLATPACDPIDSVTHQAYATSTLQPLAPQQSASTSPYLLTTLSLKHAHLLSHPLLIGEGICQHEAMIEPFKCVSWRDDEHTYLRVHWRGFEFEKSRRHRTQLEHHDEQNSSGQGQLCAPVPGRIVKVSCAVGNTVQADESLFVLESMKMEFDLKAPCNGTVEALTAHEGEQVNAGTVLARIVPTPTPTHEN